MKRILLSVTPELFEALEQERRKRMLPSIPETARTLLSEQLTKEKN